MSKFGFDKVLRNIETMKRDLPKVLANDALRYFNDSFVQGGWDGQKWQTPQRKIPGTNAYKYPKKGANARHTRATLVQTGRLRREVRNSLKLTTFDKIRFTVNLPYAAIHNQGGDVEVSEHSRGIYTKHKTTSYQGLKKSKKTGKFYMQKSTKTIFLRTGESNVSSHVKKMPQRKFMGQSKTLTKLQLQKINKAMKQIWQA